MIQLFKTIGDIGQFALPIGMGLHILYKGYRKEFVAFGICAGIQQLILLILKKNIVSPRPFPNDMILDSFPSGHTAAAFLAVGYLLVSHRSYLTMPYKIAVIVMAAIVGMSRYACNMHWPLDILAGASLGMLCGAGAKLIPQWVSKKVSHLN